MWLMTLPRSFLFLLMTDFLLADDNFTWTFPPPAWTPRDRDDVRTVNFTVLDGSTNVALRWNYTLGSGEMLAFTQWKIDESNIGFLSTVPPATVYDNRFIISTSEIATVIIKNVADINDATFECQVTTSKAAWKYKISVEITVEASLTSYTADQTVTEGAGLSLFCNATGKPTPNIIWSRVWENGTNGEQVFLGNPWVIVNINRSATGTYRCTANNGIGNPVNHSLYVNVTYKPDMVTIVTNTTENKDCSDLWVNFTCVSSEANPPVYNYLLSDEDGFSFSKSGTWIKKISKGGKSIYNCTAYQLVGNVTSTNNITLTVNVPLAVGQTKNKTVHEGDNAELYCNMSGIPDPTVIWTKVQDGDYNAEEGKLLNIINITRAQAGKYKCNANNTCGEESAVAYIDVQYKPENVHLTTNTTSKVCRGDVINFTCTAEANPAVHTYLLYENDTVIEIMGISGTWTKEMENSGQFVFRCEANNSIYWQEIQTSDDTVLTVDVPASVEQVENKIVIEGENVEEYCVTGGIPNPAVMWTNVKTGEHIKENPLNITNINRTHAGEYRCTANNTCGEASTVMNINVQYKPENVHLTTNTTSKVCTGDVINFTCTAEANPAVHTYLLYENDTVIENMTISRTWIKAMENDGQFVYRCEANNSIHWQEIQTSDDTILTVDVPASVEQVKNILNVTEGENVEEYCNVTAGIPDPTVMWTNVKTGEHIKENPLNITNINRTQAGEYRCTANNTCGEASTVMNINVQYPPDIVDISINKTVNESDTVVLNCTAVANPTASITWTRVSDNSPVSFPLNITGKQDDGGYRCTAENSIPDPASKTTYISVENYHPIETKLNTSVNPVTLNETFNITCSAQANPAAKYRFYKNQTYVFNDTSGKDVAVFPTLVHERVPKVNYSCTPFNKFGDGPTGVISVPVLFAPFVTDGNRTRINCPIYCPVDGNPPPNITWYKGNGPSTKISNVNTKKLPESVCNSGLYTCFAENHLGNVTVTLKVIIVENPAPTTSLKPATKDPGNKASDISGRMKVTNALFKEELTNLSSECSKNLTTRVKNGFHEVYQSTEKFKSIYNDTRMNKFENGSVVVFFTIIFNGEVDKNDAILVLKQASENGPIGDLKVEAESIKLLPSVPTTLATSSPTATTSATPGHDTKVWIIIGALVGGAIVLVVIVVVAWCVHHKRKCRRKGSKVCCSESEEQAFTPREDNDPGHVNNGYAEAGPRPTAMVDMSQHQGASVAPTYAVVDKSAKKGSMKDKKDEEKKPQTEPPQYSVVDKSKKKKKKKKKEEEPEATYAQVDMSKKSKKKAKPGEVLYADLGDFHQMQELPNVSTSPKALPPIKKPAPYVETQYADITQFLKGDVTLPDSDKSQGPATGTQPAPVPDNQESQEPGTSAKETSQASNPGGDGGPGHETNF